METTAAQGEELYLQTVIFKSSNLFLFTERAGQHHGPGKQGLRRRQQVTEEEAAKRASPRPRARGRPT